MEYYDPRDYELAGRIGVLKTNHGVIETPFLFPVIDPYRQAVSLDRIRDIGFNAFITNAYLLYRRMRGEVFNIHDYFNWNNPIMTDSGGYQVLVYGSIDVDNKTIISYEKNIETDIAVILDVPTGARMSWSEAYDALRETMKRGLEALPYLMDSKQLWVYPVQGAPYRDLVEYSSKTGSRLPYHIYALGSPTVFLEKYEYSVILELTIIARRNLPPEKPLHVFGVGHPMIIPFLVAVGADLFDSASYILYARDDRMMFEWGTQNLNELHYIPCNCPVCSKYSVEELREMNSDEKTALLALHNLYMIWRELSKTKQAIKEGRLWEYIEQKSKQHPSLRKAFIVLKKHLDHLARHNPDTNASGQAIYMIDGNSVHNPRLITIRGKVVENMLSYKGSRIILVPAVNKPFNRQKILDTLGENVSQYHVLLYHPYLGLFPPELSNTYPYFQHEVGEYYFTKKIVDEIIHVLDKLEPSEIILYVYRIGNIGRLVNSLVKKYGDKITIRALKNHDVQV